MSSWELFLPVSGIPMLDISRSSSIWSLPSFQHMFSVVSRMTSFSFHRIPAATVTCCRIISISPSSLLPSPVLVQSPQRSNIPSSLVFFAFVAPVLFIIYPFSSPVFLPP